MKPRGAALALVLLSARALADGPSIFEKAATFEPTIHFAKIGAIEIEPILQARWTGTETSGASEAQLDVQTMFDAEIVPPNPVLGVLESSGPQVAARVQLVLAL